jgi:hypothetical protein
MARDFLAIPFSTVPSEQAFSLEGRILGESRSSLTPEMLEALVRRKDWLFNEKEEDIEGITIICINSLFYYCLLFFQAKAILTRALQVKFFVKISQPILLPNNSFLMKS